MWWRTRCVTASVVRSRGACQRRRSSSASPAPTVSWPWKWPSAASPACRCRAGGRPGGRWPDRPGPPRRRRSGAVWSHRSSPGTLFWATPRCAASSGTMTREQPASVQRAEPDRRPRRPQELPRAPPRPARRTGVPRGGALDADRGQRRRLDREVERRPRAGRPAASAGRPRRSACAGSPTARRTRRSTSSRPPNGSTSALVPRRRAPPQAIALTVKSRRARSTSTRSPNSTRWGRRKSAYSWSRPEGRDLDVHRGPSSEPDRRLRLRPPGSTPTATVPNAFS